MPFLPDIQLSAVSGETSDDKFESLVRQINEWGRTISNEKKTEVYKDNSGTNRILIGVLPDGETGIVISNEGVDVLSLFD